MGYVIHFSVLAILSGADSYRKIHLFIKKRFKHYKKKFNLKWKKAPSYTTIRNIINGVDSLGLETIFRKHAEVLSSCHLLDGEQVELAFDGKVIRGSFDHFKDQSAIQFLSVFCTNNNLILAHEEIECKTNEIPVAQQIITKMKPENVLYTCDALSVAASVFCSDFSSLKVSTCFSIFSPDLYILRLFLDFLQKSSIKRIFFLFLYFLLCRAILMR